MRLRFTLIVIAVFIAMYIGYQQSAAQNIVTCPGLVQRAIDSVGDNCGGMDRNSACYGFSDVDAAFSVAQPVSFFTAPSDRARLLELESLNTSPMVESLGKWGIALLSVQANLPDTLPGQSVVFMLMGDTQVENAVTPEDTFQTGTTVNVTLSIGADLYYEAGLGAQVVGSIPQGTALTADAVSDDGQWVRVVYRGTPGWITRQVLATDGDLSTLPVIGPDTKTPMQAFYFRTSISGTQCTEAPNALVVQGPENLMVDININGADVRLGSTVAFYLLPVDPATLQYLVSLYGEIGAINRLMQILVIDGHVILNAGTDEEMELNTGETTFICLTDPENLGADGESNDRTVFTECPWAPPRPVTVEDLERFRELEGFTLNYPIELPLLLPTVTPTFTNTPRPFVPFVPTATPVPPTNTPEPGQPTQPPAQPTQPPQNPTQTPVNPTQTSVPPTPTFTNTPCDPIPTVTDESSLIAAINAANDEVCHPGADTIALNSVSFTFISVDNNTDGPNALPSITSTITLNGYGNFSNDASLRYFHVSSGGNLTLNNVYLADAAITGANGGAIYNAGTANLSNITFEGNSADNGGAIYNTGTLSLYNSRLAVEVGNTASSNGGGIYNSGTATIDKTAITSNSAYGSGGGIYNTGTLNLLNSTIAYNSGYTGFGLVNAGGTSTLNFTTIYENGGETGANLEVTGGSVTSKNSIVAGSNTDCSGSVSVQGVNFSDDTSCSGFTTVGDVGIIYSNQLDPDSPAVDAATDCTTTASVTVTDDQRGMARPQDNGSNACDAGSYELEMLIN